MHRSRHQEGPLGKAWTEAGRPEGPSCVNFSPFHSLEEMR